MDPRVIVDPATSLEVVVPPFASDERALVRARRLARGELGHLRLEPEYGCILPLWGPGGQASDLANQLLSTKLCDALTEWHRIWEASFIFPTGWVSDDARSRWLLRGEELYLQLLLEVWDDYEIDPGFRRAA